MSETEAELYATMQSKTFGKAPTEFFGDRYQIERQLGKRAGRYTLLARDLQTQSQVVIKRLSFGEDFAWEDLKLFEREAAILKNLSHHAIPRYLDYFELGTRKYGFFGNAYLSQNEIDWLAQELSLWLKLPIVPKKISTDLS